MTGERYVWSINRISRIFSNLPNGDSAAGLFEAGSQENMKKKYIYIYEEAEHVVTVKQW